MSPHNSRSARSKSPAAGRQKGGRARSPPSSHTRSRSIGGSQEIVFSRMRMASPDHHRATLRLLERAETERDVTQHENDTLKRKIKHLKQRLHEAKTMFDLDPHQTSTRPLMRMRKRDIARPYVEKGIMSGTIYMIGEAIACGLLFQKDLGYGFYPSAFLHYSVLHSTLVGMLANGPLLHLFFEVIERVICFQSELYNVLCKIILDQVCWGEGRGK